MKTNPRINATERLITLAAGTLPVVLASLLWAPNALAGADPMELRLLSSLALKPVVEVLGPQFERETGYRLIVKYELTPAVKSKIDVGEGFDVAVANPSHIDSLIKSGKIVGSSSADIARFVVGVGVKAGAAKPDVSSVDALKRTLLAAGSVAYVSEGTSGVYVKSLLQRLNITQEMSTKLKSGGLTAVANGGAEIVLMPMPLILAAQGVELAGAVPAEYQDPIELTAGLSSAAAEPAAGRALIQLLMRPEATELLKAKGYERMVPAVAQATAQ